MFFVLVVVKAFQWICFSSITNIVASHYGVSDIAINWTTVIFMITFLLLGLPVARLMELIGLRNSILIGTFGTNVGVIMKCFACDRNGFVLAMFGHVLVGCVEPFFFSVYSKMAQVWFPDNQVALATAIGVCGESMGTALGFIVPSLMVGDDPNNHERITDGLFKMFVGIAIATSINSAFIILFFDEQPKKAPGYARHKQIQLDATRASGPSFLQRSYLEDLKSFFRDKNFLIVGVAFGLNEGSGYAVHTLLNQILVAGEDPNVSFENPVLVTGIAGSILLLVGVVGSVFCGHLLDRFHAYKPTMLLVYLFSLTSMVGFSVCLRQNNLVLLYSVIAALGFFLSGYMCCGFDVAVEITYPRSEIMSSTILNMLAQVFGIIITFAGSKVVDDYGGQAGCWFLSAALAIGLLINCAMRPNYRRQRAIGDQQQVNELSHIAGRRHRWYHCKGQTC